MQAQTVIIANGQSLSGVAVVSGALVGILMSAQWTAANLTLQGSADGVTFADLYDASGNEVVITAAANHYITLAPASYAGCVALKVRSGTGASPVTQGADRTLTLMTRTV